MTNPKDLAYLEMAYSLAEKAKGWASPNPYVGALVVRRGEIIGWGYHEKPGRPHAEIIALERAGRRAKGSTLYLTLEPCVHWGRTPPCIDAVLVASPGRVVISSPDPNPIVFNKGIKRLRAAGIDTSVGQFKERNAILNEAYIKFITRGIPFVTLKAAVSLDSRMATRTGDSRWISSPETRTYVHLIRGEHDGLMVGINTLLRDDPRLTVRHPHWKGKKIARIVLDSRLRFPLRSRILSTLEKGDILVFASREAPPKKKAALESRGVEVIVVSGSPRGIKLPEVLCNLGERGIAGLLVEGGSRLLTSFIEERLADKLLLTVSPRLIGGERAPSFLEGRGIGRIGEALELRDLSTFHIGGDIIMIGYL
jgi:diaminohydroxyphosphoribosylaminopyrimidine deaminase/5-amino-6-(5-phosphoribosylamino)uracil reductase